MNPDVKRALEAAAVSEPERAAILAFLKAMPDRIAVCAVWYDKEIPVLENAVPSRIAAELERDT